MVYEYGGDPPDRLSEKKRKECGPAWAEIDLHAIGRFRVSSPLTATPTVENLSEPARPALPFDAARLCVPCFTPGTRITTDKGERSVENITPGTLLVTRDNGLQPVQWVGRMRFDWQELRRNPHLRPILVRRGALGDAGPDRDMLLSPNHRVLVTNDRTSLYFDDYEVLVAAKHLIDNQGVSEVEAFGVTYVHMLFDRHEIVLANGCWTESFQPADFSLGAIGNAQRSEIFELFPDLKSPEGIAAFTDARPTVAAVSVRSFSR